MNFFLKFKGICRIWWKCFFNSGNSFWIMDTCEVGQIKSNAKSGNVCLLNLECCQCASPQRKQLNLECAMVLSDLGWIIRVKSWILLSVQCTWYIVHLTRFIIYKHIHIIYSSMSIIMIITYLSTCIKRINLEKIF